MNVPPIGVVAARMREAGAFARWLRWAGLAAWAAYGVFLWINFVPVAGGSDSSGYMNSAKLLASGRLAAEPRPIPELRARSPFDTVPLGFVRREGSSVLAPTYPTGMPLQFALAGLVLGPTLGVTAVCVGSALAAVWLCYALARRLGVSESLALAGAVLLAINPVFVFIALQPLSDVAATTWCLAALYAALRGRESRNWSLWCGAATAMAVLVRPSNVLIFPALLVALPRWRSLLWVAVGGLPGAVWMLTYQKRLYGNALTSGYGDISTLFRAENLAPTLAHYAEWIPRFIPLLVIVGFVGVVIDVRRRWVPGLMLATWAAAILAFYVFYEVTKEAWWCLRFVLPAFPPLIIGGLLGWEALRSRWPARLQTGWALGLSVVVLAFGGFQAKRWSRRLDATGPSRNERSFLELTEWADAHLPRHSVVATLVASGAVFYYSDLAVLRWDMVSAEEFAAFARATDLTRQPVYALLFFGEDKDAFKRMPGEWEQIFRTSRGGVWQLRRAP